MMSATLYFVPRCASLVIGYFFGCFLTGALVGRVCYKDKTTVVPPRHDVTRRITAPFEFIGRHSLLIYLAHQPIVIGICYLLAMVLK